MSVELTGANLSSYMLKICRDAIYTNARFKNTLGDVVVTMNNMISFGDAQIVVKEVSASGVRLSPDYFMYIQRGRVVAAKVVDKPGAFLEWVVPNKSSIKPGVYYLNVAAVDDSTNSVTLTTKTFYWYEGKTDVARGSRIVFRSGIDPTAVTVLNSIPIGSVGGYDTTTFPNNTVMTLNGSQYLEAETENGPGECLLLISPFDSLQILASNGVTLTPNVDYWWLRWESIEISTSLPGGQQLITIPGEWVGSLTFRDGDDYTLRTGVDYTQPYPNTVLLGVYTPAGSSLYAEGFKKVNPTMVSAIDPENIVSIPITSVESVVSSQTQATTPSQGNVSLIQTASNTLIPSSLMIPGDVLSYEVRIDSGIENSLTTSKLAVDDTLVPGFRLAIGDNVIVGDQIALVVSPYNMETNEVYGSKDNVQFAIDVKANDMATASEMAEQIKHCLLVTFRSEMEQDGVSIQEIPRSLQGESRDESGTAIRYVSSLSVSALADWELYVPLVTRLKTVDSTETPYYTSTWPSISFVPRLRVCGSYIFSD